MNVRITAAILFLVASTHFPACAQFLISGRVVDAGSVNTDKPIAGAEVKLFDSKDKELQKTLTNSEGRFGFVFSAKPNFQGKEYVTVSKSGYSKDPTYHAVSMKHPPEMKAAHQGDILLSDLSAIRTSSQYRKLVAVNANEAQAKGDKAKANAIFAAIASIPGPERELAYGSVKAESSAAYSELMKVDEDLKKARALELSVRKDVAPGVDVMVFDPTRPIRLGGTVRTAQERDAILRQAQDLGYSNSRIVNDIRIQPLAPMVRP